MKEGFTGREKIIFDNGDEKIRNISPTHIPSATPTVRPTETQGAPRVWYINSEAGRELIIRLLSSINLDGPEQTFIVKIGRAVTTPYPTPTATRAPESSRYPTFTPTETPTPKP